MSYEKLKKVIAIGPAKEAALYFEQVAPFDQNAVPDADTIPRWIPYEDPDLSERIVRSFLPATDDPMSFYRGYNGIISSFWAIAVIRETFEDEGNCDSLYADADTIRNMNESLKLLDLDVDQIVFELRSGLFDFGEYRGQVESMLGNGLKAIGFSDAPAWHYNDDLPAHHDDGDGDGSAGPGPQNIILALKDLNLVDAEKISWEKLIAFRKDRDAQAALRDLRLFFHENFEGKETGYIVDKIHSTLDTYKAATKLWGFETVRKTLSLAISQRGAITTSVGVLTALTLGAPIAAAAAAGAALNLGGCALELGQAAIDRRKLNLDRPLRYFTKLQALG